MLEDNAIEAIIREYYRARDIYGPFRSAHEGYAILHEELDELWDAVKMKNNQSIDYKGRLRTEAMEEEVIQVGAMALRFLVDICERDIE